jgi:hypothetical protein
MTEKELKYHIDHTLESKFIKLYVNARVSMTDVNSSLKAIQEDNLIDWSDSEVLEKWLSMAFTEVERGRVNKKAFFTLIEAYGYNKFI